MIGEEIVVERLVVGGRGLGRLADGRAAFVAGACPGDRVEIEAEVERRSYVDVQAFRLVTGADERIEPVCSACATCGGCDWMPINAEAQLAGKVAMLREALERTGGFASSSLPQDLTVHRSPLPLAYRSRVRLQVKGGRVGFFSRGSHDLVEVEECPVSSEPLWQAVLAVRSAVHAASHAFNDVAHVEVRVFGAGPISPEVASAWFVFDKRRPEKEQLRRLREATAALRGEC